MSPAKCPASGEEAVVKTEITESGELPLQMEDGSTTILPVSGVSSCEQKLELTRSRLIQLVWADCETSISLSEHYTTEAAPAANGSESGGQNGGQNGNRADNAPGFMP